MTIRRLIFLIPLLFLMISPVPAGAEPARKEILIGLVPEMNVFKQMERFKALSAYLEEKTGIHINLTILSRYGNIIETFEAKKLDAAFFGSFTGAMAIAKLNLEPIARPVNLDGLSTYQGYIFVRKDSKIRKISDMKGKRMAFVEKATTAGYIYPIAWLKEQGINDVNSFFREYYFTGSHDASINAVLNREADIGCAKNTIYNIIRKQQPRVDSELTVLTESAKVPSNSLCVRKNLPSSIKKSLREALLGIDKDPKGIEVLKKFYALKFIETTIDDYKPVFELAREAGIDLKKYRYSNTNKSGGGAPEEKE